MVMVCCRYKYLPLGADGGAFSVEVYSSVILFRDGFKWTAISLSCCCSWNENFTYIFSATNLYLSILYFLITGRLCICDLWSYLTWMQIQYFAQELAEHFMLSKTLHLQLIARHGHMNSCRMFIQCNQPRHSITTYRHQIHTQFNGL